MGAIEALREQVRMEEEAWAEQGREKIARLIARTRDQWMAELGKEVLEELGAEFGVETVELRYRGREYVGCYPKGAKAKVLDWIEKVDQWHERREEEWVLIVPKLEKCRSDYEIRRLEKGKIKNYRLLDFEDVRMALKAAWTRIAERNAKEERWRALEREERRQTLLNKVRAATSRAEWGKIWDDLADNGLIQEFRYDDEVERACKEFEGRIVAAEEEWEALREQAEREAFWPFRYYEIIYSIMMRDVDDDEKRYVDTAVFRSLSSEPEEDGWWKIVNGNVIRPVHVAAVEMKLVEVVEDLPYWCPRQDTKWGRIRVPPEDAERV